MNRVIKYINVFCITLIIGLRPLLGPALCKFEPTCTQFAITCLKEKSFLWAVWAISKRLLRCNPFN